MGWTWLGPSSGQCIRKRIKREKHHLTLPYTNIMKHSLFFAAAFAIVACQPSGESADGESGATWESKIHYDQEATSVIRFTPLIGIPTPS